jgi:hypothetical protein
VLVPLEVGELVAVTDKLIDELGESVPLSVPLNDGNAPRVTEEVGDWEIDLERLCVVDGVMLEVEVADDVPLPVGEGEAVALALIVDDDVIVGVMVALNETDGVLLALPPMLRVLVAVAEIVEERLFVVDPLSLPVGVCVGVCDEVPVPDRVGDEVPLSDAPWDGVAEGVELCAIDFDGGVSDDEDVQVAVGVNVLEPVDESEPVSALEDDVVSVAVKLLDGDCDDDIVCVNDGVWDDEGVVEPESDAIADMDSAKLFEDRAEAEVRSEVDDVANSVAIDDGVISDK